MTCHAARTLRPAPIPRHLAVIMDGNGRWAERRRRPRIIGHRAGARAVNVCIDFCLERGIEALTLFAFSSENWGRPEEEVGALMKLFLNALDREVENCTAAACASASSANASASPTAIRERMQRGRSADRRQRRACTLIIAASYGGRQDIAQAARALAEDVAAGSAARRGHRRGRCSPRAWRWPTCRRRTCSSAPAATMRISNFLLWQLAYTELWFTDTAVARARCRHPAARAGRFRRPRTPLRPDQRAGRRHRRTPA